MRQLPLLLFLIIISSCAYNRLESEKQADENFVPVTFADDILPLIEFNCAGCHNGDMAVDLLSYSNAAANADKILDRIQRTPGSTGFMPQDFPPLTNEQIQLFKRWNTEGLRP